MYNVSERVLLRILTEKQSYIYSAAQQSVDFIIYIGIPRRRRATHHYRREERDAHKMSDDDRSLIISP